MTTVYRFFFARQPTLTRYAGLCLLGLAVTLVLQRVDHRLLDGVNVWVKPAKFFASVALYSLTLATFMGEIAPERRQNAATRFVVWATVLCGSFELLVITERAAEGVASHFNVSTTLNSGLYSLMGVMVIVLITAMLPVAWVLARFPRKGLSSPLQWAMISGLVLSFALGGGFAGHMSGTLSHNVGAVGGHMPLMGWNRTGGDFRVAHFFGLHLMQAIPLAVWSLARQPVVAQWLGFGVATIGGVSLSVAVFLQALAGQPFLPWLV